MARVQQQQSASNITPPSGWQLVGQPDYYRLFAATSGKERSGKTDFALQLPKPLAYIPLDRRRVPGQDPDRMFPPGVVEPVNPDNPDLAPFRFDPRLPAADQVKEIWPRAEDAILSAVEDKFFRSLVIDTGSALWEMIRLQVLGKLAQVMPEKYMDANMLFRSVIEAIEDRGDLNCIICHKVKKEYVDRGGGRGNWNGEYEQTGFGEIGFMVNHQLRHTRVTDDDGGTKYALEVVDSTNTAAVGTVWNEATDEIPITLSSVAQLLLPGSKAKDWV
ncbi:MAG TPA: hypothetical protein VF982_03720 [Anaerolineales bacterium]